MLEIVAKNFADALPPVGQHADAGFQVEVEGDFFHGAANELFGGAGNVPRQVEFLGENVGGAAGKKGEWDAVTVLISGEAVDDFVEGTIAAAGDYQAAAFKGGALGNFRGVAGAGGFREFGIDTASGKNMASRIERAAAAFASPAGVGIVNQQSVSKTCSHRWFRLMPFVCQDIHSI